MNKQILHLIYCMFLNRGGKRICCIEKIFKFEEVTVVPTDGWRNESELYSSLFTGESRLELETLYLELLRDMRNVPYEQCEDLLEALTFLQQMLATAMWKYHHDVGWKMEAFTRDFDRLDVESERMRLYQYAQQA